MKVRIDQASILSFILVKKDAENANRPRMEEDNEEKIYTVISDLLKSRRL